MSTCVRSCTATSNRTHELPPSLFVKRPCESFIGSGSFIHVHFLLSLQSLFVILDQNSHCSFRAPGFHLLLRCPTWNLAGCDSFIDPVHVDFTYSIHFTQKGNDIMMHDPPFKRLEPDRSQQTFNISLCSSRLIDFWRASRTQETERVSTEFWASH